MDQPREDRCHRGDRVSRVRRIGVTGSGHAHRPDIVRDRRIREGQQLRHHRVDTEPLLAGAVACVGVPSVIAALLRSTMINRFDPARESAKAAYWVPASASRALANPPMTASS